MQESDLQPTKELGHEPEGIVARWIWLFAAILAVTVIFTLGLVWVLLRVIAASEGYRGETPQAQVPMASGVPELDANQVVEMRRLRRLEADLLDSYEWVDPPTGIARIPIERAMAIAAEKGLGAINAAEAAGASAATTTTEATTGLPPATQSEAAGPGDETVQPEGQTIE